MKKENHLFRGFASRLPEWVGLSLVVALGGLVGCEEGPLPPPDTLRFGQVGSLRVTVITPLRLGSGEIQQILDWNSDGPWYLREEISYEGSKGDDSDARNPGQATSFAISYAGLITQLNDNEALSLFIPSLDPDLDPGCAVDQSTVTVRIRDDLRNEEVSWSRCDGGPLEDLTPVGSGPDPDASRVIVAAILARDLALGKTWDSEYHGSQPFGTLDKGEASGIGDLSSQTFFLGAELSDNTRPPSSWPDFWESHSGGTSPVPEVDWGTDMVVVVGDGIRLEAGDSLEVRRVLQVSNGGQIEPVERVPGDFCSPASRVQTPFHIVVTPRVPPPIRFSDLRVERVPCGI